MKWIDLKHAIENNDDNFTCLLFRLILKADANNRAALSLAYPTEVIMAELYQYDCSYKDLEKTQVDYQMIEIRAERILKEGK